MSFSPRYPSFSGLECLQLYFIQSFQESQNFQPNALSAALKGEFRSTEKVNSVVEKGEPQFTRIDSNKQIEVTGRFVGQTTESSNVNFSSCSQEEWLDNLKKQYPDHELDYELTKFQDHCESKGTPPNRKGFEGWMKKAFIPKKIKKAAKKDIPPEYDFSW